MTKYVGKAYDIDDITYILEEYSEQIPEEVVSDIYFKLLDYVPTEESTKTQKHEQGTTYRNDLG